VLPPVVGLVNLAGIPSPVGLLDLEVNEWNKVMAVNSTGSFLMMQAAARRMITGGVGRIVNTASITAFDGGGTFSKVGYAAAKAAVLGLTRGGARELGQHGITVNAIAPGPIDTDVMGGTLTEDRKAAMAADALSAASGVPRTSPRWSPSCSARTPGSSRARRTRSTGASTCTEHQDSSVVMPLTRCAVMVFWTIPTGYLTGVAAASGTALINSLGSLGGFVAPNVKSRADSTFSLLAGVAAMVSAAPVELLRQPPRPPAPGPRWPTQE